MKEIITYTRAAINTPTDLKLFTAGPTGLLFTAISASGLTLKAGLARGGTVQLPSNPVGAGLGFGDSLLVSGTGDILLTMWGSLEETYLINGTALEVIIATPIPFAKAGVVGSTPVAASKTTLIKPGLYTENSYRFVSPTDRTITW